MSANSAGIHEEYCGRQRADNPSVIGDNHDETESVGTQWHSAQDDSDDLFLPLKQNEKVPVDAAEFAQARATPHSLSLEFGCDASRVFFSTSASKESRPERCCRRAHNMASCWLCCLSFSTSVGKESFRTDAWCWSSHVSLTQGGAALEKSGSYSEKRLRVGLALVEQKLLTPITCNVDSTGPSIGTAPTPIAIETRTMETGSCTLELLEPHEIVVHVGIVRG